MKIEPLLRLYKWDINTIINRYLNEYQNYKLEYDDLYQIATIKLWQISNIPNLNRNFILRCINNAIIDYVKKWCKDPVSNADSYEDIHK